MVKEIRGMGLMIGMEFNDSVADKLVDKALKDKIIINKVSSSTLRFLPPLIITKREINKLIRWLNINIKDIKIDS